VVGAGRLVGRLVGLGGRSKPRADEYRGPRIWALTAEDLEAKPRPWSEFIGRMDELAASYDAPTSFGETRARLEENVVHFIPNYLRVVGLAVCMVMVHRPAGIVGLGLILLSRGVLTRLASAHSTAAEERRRRRGGRPGALDQWAALALGMLLWLVPWVIGARTQGMSLCMKGVHSGAAASLLHALLRVPRSRMGRVRQELRKGPKRVLGFGAASNDDILRALMPGGGGGAGRDHGTH